MTGVDLYLELNERQKALDEAVQDLFKWEALSRDSALAYKKERTKQLAIHRSEGMPVSILKEYVEGIDSVADLRADYDGAEGQIVAVREFIMATKVAIGSLNEQIKREWAS